MKKYLIILMLLMLSPIFSCKNDSDSNEINPAALLYLFGDKTLIVNATYTGAYTVDSTRPGTQYLYICLFESLGLNTTSPAPVYTATNSVAVTDTTPQAITITGIAPGNYYIMVFYDYRAPATVGDDPIQQNERYLFYNAEGGTYCPTLATPINVVNTSSVDITFGDTYRLDAAGGAGTGPLYDVCP